MPEPVRGLAIKASQPKQKKSLTINQRLPLTLILSLTILLRNGSSITRYLPVSRWQGFTTPRSK